VIEPRKESRKNAAVTDGSNPEIVTGNGVVLLSHIHAMEPQMNAEKHRFS